MSSDRFYERGKDFEMINGFTLTDPAAATGEQLEIFEKAEQGFGFVPNIVNAFSESPALAEAMLGLYSKMGLTGFSETESHVVLQTINVLNECVYCVPAHSTVARSKGVEVDVDEALRNAEVLNDPKLEALRVFTTQMVKQRGHLDESQFEAFIESGWDKRAALDVVYLHTVKTLTNYGNHIAGTDLDKQFQGLAWEPSGTGAGV